MPAFKATIVKQHGVALIEVMVAVLLMSVGLMGYSALQVRALVATQSSLQRTTVSILAGNMLEVMRANKTQAIDPSVPYNMATSCVLPPAGSTLIQNDLNTWFRTLQVALGDSSSTCGAILCSDVNSAAPGTCTVTIQWDDSRALGGLRQQSIQLVGRL